MILVFKKMTVSLETLIIKPAIIAVKRVTGFGIHLTQVCSFQSPRELKN